MNKYEFTASVTVSCRTVVEANSKKEAMAIAKGRPLADLCHGPHVEEVDEAFQMEADGTPSEIMYSGLAEDEDCY